MDFEQTLSQLHSWLNEHVAVMVSPRLRGAFPLQVAGFFGDLSHAEEPPPHIQATFGGQTVDDEIFFFFVGEGQRNHFVLSRALFESAELQDTSLGERLFAVDLSGVRLIVILHPNG